MIESVILKNVDYFDGKSEELLRGRTIVINDGKIDAITDEDIQYESIKAIDLSGYTVTPGFIDCHMHMLLEEVPNKDIQLTMTTPGGERYPNADAAVAYLGALNCRKMLDAGFTTVIDGGGCNFIECALREALNKGYLDGPNYFIAGKQLTTNPAHFVGFSTEPYGPYGMRKAIRDLMWWGVDHVKLQLSPPIRMLGRNPNACDFTKEEVMAAIDEAHNYGVSVHAHTRGAASIKRFLKADGDIVVHGTGIDDEGIEIMVKKGTYLLPTLLSPTPNPAKELVIAKSKSVMDVLYQTAQVHWDSAKRAYQAGVKIAFSTDSGALGIPVGENASEFLNLKEIGMSNLEVLRTATSEAAIAIGKQDVYGLISKGMVADLTVMNGNPLEDLTATQSVVMTIKGGRVVSDKR